MSAGDCFLAEIKWVSFNFAPKGWAMANGQFLLISQNQALFSLLGTTYGGDGRTTFALPDLRGRVPMHFGNGHVMGERSGSEAVTLTLSQLPQHIHVANANSANATTPIAFGNLLAAANNLYAKDTNLTALHPSSISNVGGSQPHLNQQPFLTLNAIIALQGIFPSQN